MLITISKVGDTVYFWRGVSYKIGEGQQVKISPVEFHGRWCGYDVRNFRFYDNIDVTDEMRRAATETALRSSWRLAI
jgi:hypothetical protein